MVTGYRVFRIVLLSVVSVFAAVAPAPSQALAQVPDKPTPSSTTPVVSPSPHPAPASASSPADPQSEYVGKETCDTCQQDMPSTGFVEHFKPSRHFVSTHQQQRSRPAIPFWIPIGAPSTRVAFKNAAWSPLNC